MKRAARLVLKKETLTELGDAELRAVAGAGTTYTCDMTYRDTCDRIKWPSETCPPIPTLSGPAC